MNLVDFKKSLLSKTVGRSIAECNTLFEADDFAHRVFTGLKRIATDTVVLRLIENDPTTIKIYRKIDSATYIRMPEIPIDDLDEVDTDEALIDALGYFVMAGLERQNANSMMGLYHQEIDTNNTRLMETELDVNEDEAQPSEFP